jgi:8-amino-7-oxononanoate synthase
LIVDEAHAVGIYGEAGSGLIEQNGCGGDVFLSINPAGKALGAAGAFVAGPSWAIDFLIQKARTLIFSTAAPPSIAAALDAALDIVAAEPERRAKLRRRANDLRRRLHDGGLPVEPEGSQIIPVVIGDNDYAVELADNFTARGFDVRAIRPPTVPAGTARLRISVNVKTDDGDLQRFADQLCAACAKIFPSIAASS